MEEKTLLHVVDSLKEHFTSTDWQKRHEGLNILQNHISTMHSSLNAAELNCVVKYLRSRLEDRAELVTVALNSLNTLMAPLHAAQWSEEQVQDTVQICLDHVDPHQLKTWRMRQPLYEFLYSALCSHPVAIEKMKKDFASSLLSRLEGEADPRNLVIVFPLVHKVLATLPVGPLTEHYFEYLMGYFPINYKPPTTSSTESSPSVITREHLLQLHTQCLTAHPRMVSLVLPLVLQHVTGSAPLTMSEEDETFEKAPEGDVLLLLQHTLPLCSSGQLREYEGSLLDCLLNIMKAHAGLEKEEATVRDIHNLLVQMVQVHTKDAGTKSALVDFLRMWWQRMSAEYLMVASNTTPSIVPSTNLVEMNRRVQIMRVYTCGLITIISEMKCCPLVGRTLCEVVASALCSRLVILLEDSGTSSSSGQGILVEELVACLARLFLVALVFKEDMKEVSADEIISTAQTVLTQLHKTPSVKHPSLHQLVEVWIEAEDAKENAEVGLANALQPSLRLKCVSAMMKCAECHAIIVTSGQTLSTGDDAVTRMEANLKSIWRVILSVEREQEAQRVAEWREALNSLCCLVLRIQMHSPSWTPAFLSKEIFTRPPSSEELRSPSWICEVHCAVNLATECSVQCYNQQDLYRLYADLVLNLSVFLYQHRLESEDMSVLSHLAHVTHFFWSNCLPHLLLGKRGDAFLQARMSLQEKLLCQVAFPLHSEEFLCPSWLLDVSLWKEVEEKTHRTVEHVEDDVAAMLSGIFMSLDIQQQTTLLTRMLKCLLKEATDNRIPFRVRCACALLAAMPQKICDQLHLRQSARECLRSLAQSCAQWPHGPQHWTASVALCLAYGAFVNKSFLTLQECREDVLHFISISNCRQFKCMIITWILSALLHCPDVPHQDFDWLSKRLVEQCQVTGEEEAAVSRLIADIFCIASGEWRYHEVSPMSQDGAQKLEYNQTRVISVGRMWNELISNGYVNVGPLYWQKLQLILWQPWVHASAVGDEPQSSVTMLCLQLAPKFPTSVLSLTDLCHSELMQPVLLNSLTHNSMSLVEVAVSTLATLMNRLVESSSTVSTDKETTKKVIPLLNEELVTDLVKSMLNLLSRLDTNTAPQLSLATRRHAVEVLRDLAIILKTASHNHNVVRPFQRSLLRVVKLLLDDRKRVVRMLAAQCHELWDTCL